MRAVSFPPPRASRDGARLRLKSLSPQRRYLADTLSGAFQNHIGVRGGVAGPNQADGERDALLELRVRFVFQLDSPQGVAEGGARRGRVVPEAFPRHPGPSDFEVWPQRPQNF